MKTETMLQSPHFSKQAKSVSEEKRPLRYPAGNDVSADLNTPDSVERRIGIDDLGILECSDICAHYHYGNHAGPSSLLPFYAADEKNPLPCGNGLYSVVDILENVFHEDFRKAAQCYMDAMPKWIGRASGRPDAKSFELTWLGRPKVESSLLQPARLTAVDLIFHATANALIPESIADSAERESDGTKKGILRRSEKKSGRKQARINEGAYLIERVCFELRMRYYIALLDGRCSAPMVAPSCGFPMDFITRQDTAITNQYLLPVMFTEDYVKAGRRMLEQYFPEALKDLVPVDGEVMAHRMGLDVRYVHLEKGSDVQGRIFFDHTLVCFFDDDGVEKQEMIPPMTVLVNLDQCPTREIINSTIVHECCHAFLDLPFFKLQILSGRPHASYTSRRKGCYPYSNRHIDWMELHAEKLHAYVLMEERITKAEIERLLALRGGARSPENMYWIMMQLSHQLDVTRTMAKYRMVELGYPEANGIFSYVDNIRIPDHGCAGKWEKGITYTISRTDAGALLHKSKEFRDLLESGRYTYVEAHYCLNDERFIVQDKWHRKYLTPYARRHIDECCISFLVQGRHTQTTYEGAQAFRKKAVKNSYLSRHELNAEPKTKARERQNDLFSHDSQVWIRLAEGMPGNIEEAIKMILDLKGITQLELSMRLGVSRTAWRKWCIGRMSLRHVVAICIALDVRADIGMALAQLSGYSFLHSVEDNILYAMLFETKDLTVGRANEIMRQNGLMPLTQGEDEALAG